MLLRKWATARGTRFLGAHDGLRWMATTSPRLAAPELTVSSISDDVQSEMNKRKRTGKLPSSGNMSLDQLMGEILERSMDEKASERDGKGSKPPVMEDIYAEAQARLYQQEYGQRPPSQQRDHYKYFPLPPTLTMQRIVAQEMFDDDPAPERSITPENPVLSKLEADVLAQKRQSGTQLSDAEQLMEEVRNRNIHAANRKACFVDAIEEVAFWELRYLQFLRDVPISQRRTLPLLHEHYRLLTHRLVRACDHYVKARDAALVDAKASPLVYAWTEDQLGRARSVYVETYKSLANLQADPVRMKKFFTGRILKMNQEQFDDWKNEQRQWRNELIAEFS